MKPLYWLKNTYLKYEDALIHAETSMAGQVGQKCPAQDDGFGCTLFTHHSGEHEAWGGGQKYHSWPNINQNEVH